MTASSDTELSAEADKALRAMMKRYGVKSRSAMIERLIYGGIPPQEGDPDATGD